MELNPDPGSTIQASQEYKDAWYAKYGDAATAPAANAPKAEWVDYAVDHKGVDRDDAEDMTKTELQKL